MKIGLKIKRLVIDECACYSSALNGIKNYCDKEQEEDYICSLFKDKRCGYFEKSVLPMNPQLEALYRAENKAKYVGYELTKQEKEKIIEEKSLMANKVRINCKRCGKPFWADNYRQQYCKICKKYLRRESTRNAMSKKRYKCEQSVL